MRIQVSGKTDIGRKRKINQDSLLMDHQLKLYVVADGMGGHKGGEVASKLACETLQAVLGELLQSQKDQFDPIQALKKAFQEASRVVYLEANKPGGEDLKGMGTTMVAAFFYEKMVYFANVGDSRAYLFQNSYLWRVTEDHSLVNEQLRSGVLTEEELETAGGKNVITRSVGFAPDVATDVFYRNVVPGEKFMLCSDGLHGMVKDEWIQEKLKSGDLDRFVDESITEANEQGGDDNLTCLFIELEP